MAELNAAVPSLVDVAKRTDPDGKIADIAELLAQKNDVLKDAVWIESNLPTGHRSVVRTTLPTVSWRTINGAVTPSKSTTAQNEDSIGILEAWFEVDKDLAMLNGNTQEFRASEAEAFVESMTQEWVDTLFHGNSGTAPEEFNGFATRYSATSLALGQNIITGGGSQSDNSSIWLIGWAKDKVACLYPKGSIAGLQHDDFGLQPITGTTGIGGTRLLAYQERWQWKCGLMVKDWRYAVRIPNIDIGSLVSKSSAADLFDLMIKATHRIPMLSACKPAFYMNRDCFQMLDIQARDDVTSGGQLRFDIVDGRPLHTFRGIPVRICDKLLTSESVVS